ncbi:hypothetical protein AMJ48_00100 [Parcubacteria bacterium DG_74_1]|nr:MAG: hypothetical protein AMJ48_00100 [Parcubacteria bacterium DG_74_1]
MSLKIIFNKKGQIAILVTLLILTAILLISIGLIVLNVREIKMARNVKESVQAIAAASAGMEYILENKSVPPAASCDLGNWQTVDAAEETFYCLKEVPISLSESAWISIGWSGSVRRAMYAPAPIGLDQAMALPVVHEGPPGHEPCRCGGAGKLGPEVEVGKPYAQTFVAGRDGDLYRADIYMEAFDAGSIYTNTLRAEIRNIDPSYTDNFYASSTDNPGATKPESIAFPAPPPLASTTDFDIINDEGAHRYDIAFNFDPPAPVASGTAYALVVYYDAPPGEHIEWASCCTERRYLPGKGWRWTGLDWAEKGNSADPSAVFDLVFAIYIFCPPGDEFGEIKP